jgi:hypothetical protein
MFLAARHFMDESPAAASKLIALPGFWQRYQKSPGALFWNKDTSSDREIARSYQTLKNLSSVILFG